MQLAAASRTRLPSTQPGRTLVGSWPSARHALSLGFRRNASRLVRLLATPGSRGPAPQDATKGARRTSSTALPSGALASLNQLLAAKTRRKLDLERLASLTAAAIIGFLVSYGHTMFVQLARTLTMAPDDLDHLAIFLLVFNIASAIVGHEQPPAE